MALPSQVDRDTMDMLRAMNMANLPGLQLQQVGPSGVQKPTIRYPLCAGSLTPTPLIRPSVQHAP